MNGSAVEVTGLFRGARNPFILLLLGSLVLLSGVVRLAGMGHAVSSGILPEDPGDVPYVRHLLISLMHLLPGMAFVLLGPVQFMPEVRRRWPAWHRWSGRVFILSGIIVAGSAIAISRTFPPLGGQWKASAVCVFSIAEIVALVVALRAILRRDVRRHRAWMIRAFAIGLGVSTMRIYFIPAYLMFGIPGDVHIGVGMWIGFGVNVIVAEVILARERARQTLGGR